MVRCSSHNKNGKRCKLHCAVGSKKCYVHSCEMKEEEVSSYRYLFSPECTKITSKIPSLSVRDIAGMNLYNSQPSINFYQFFMEFRGIQTKKIYLTNSHFFIVNGRCAYSIDSTFQRKYNFYVNSDSHATKIYFYESYSRLTLKSIVDYDFLITIAESLNLNFDIVDLERGDGDKKYNLIFYSFGIPKFRRIIDFSKINRTENFAVKGVEIPLYKIIPETSLVIVDGKLYQTSSSEGGKESKIIYREYVSPCGSILGFQVIYSFSEKKFYIWENTRGGFLWEFEKCVRNSVLEKVYSEVVAINSFSLRFKKVKYLSFISGVAISRLLNLFG